MRSLNVGFALGTTRLRNNVWITGLCVLCIITMTVVMNTVSYAAGATLLIIGDSLSSGYGMDERLSWPRLLEQRLRDQGFTYHVVNISISGETSRGGLTRLPTALDRYQPSIVLIALGANDGLRGLSLQLLEKQLSEMIEMCQRKNAIVLLAEMRIPPNYGSRYSREFQAIYHRLADRHRVTLIPFLLNGVATDPHWMQPDGLHPTAAAQPRILDNVWPLLAPFLQ